jgi:hypothetical protein
LPERREVREVVGAKRFFPLLPSYRAFADGDTPMVGEVVRTRLNPKKVEGFGHGLANDKLMMMPNWLIRP